MKKLASFALAFALCAACAVPVLADETKATTIKANIPSSYTVVIPAETTIQFDHTETKLEGTLHLSAAQLDPGHSVKISATPNALQNSAATSETIPFTLYANNSPFDSATLNSDGKLNAGASANFTPWTPIGKKGQPFAGMFDGNGKTIRGLYIDDSSKNYVGLFGCVGKSGTATGTVQKVTLADSYVRENKYVGGICGYNNGGTIEQSTNQTTVTGCEQAGGICGYNSGNITSCTAGGSVSTTSGDSVGGICGYNNTGGTVKSCTSGCTVEGKDSNTGGICGYNWGGLLGCRNTGTVSGRKMVGGVCGNNRSSGNAIQGCYNEGAVFGTMSVGGVCGSNSGNLKKSYNTGTVTTGTGLYVGGVCGTNNANLQECYNNGKVSGAKSAVGGVCGYNSNGTIQGCYNIGNVSGNDCVGGVCGQNYGGGTAENCYYLVGTSENAFGGGSEDATCESKTEIQFRNGEVAYLLQKAINDATAAGETAPQVWGQTLTGENPETYPVLGGAKVYCVEGYYHNHNGSCAACNDPGKPDKAGDTYQIASYENLLWFAKLANGTLMQGMPAKPAANAVLMKAIDITVDTVDTVGTVGKSWPGIGTSDAPYNGSFNGNGHTVSLTSADVSTAAANRRR